MPKAEEIQPNVVASASVDEVTHFFDAQIWKDRPPSLAICLNAVTVRPGRIQDGSASVKSGPVTSDHVKALIDQICMQLTDTSFEKVWDCGDGEMPTRTGLPRPDADHTDEKWARAIDELTLGTAYAGPDIVANFFNVPIPIKHIYSRFSLGDGSTAGNDPVYSIAIACQHMTTYGALTRGVSISLHLELGESRPAKVRARCPSSPPMERPVSGTTEAVRISLLPDHGCDLEPNREGQENIRLIRS